MSNTQIKDFTKGNIPKQLVIFALPLFLSEEEYKQKLEELKPDTYLVARIQEYNAKVCTQPEFQEIAAQMRTKDLTEVLEELKDDYCRSTKI